MITIILRVLLVTVGVFMAVAYYADALPHRHHPRTGTGATRWAFFWTTVAAIGVVGWAR
jgi:hypothetical protein